MIFIHFDPVLSKVINVEPILIDSYTMIMMIRYTVFDADNNVTFQHDDANILQKKYIEYASWLRRRGMCI